MTRGPARDVLAAVAEAERIRERNPTLFAAQLRAGDKTGRDRDVLQLAAAVNKQRRRQVPAKARPDRDEVERVDRTWEETEARDREDRNRGRRARMNTAQRERRRALTGIDLLQEVLRDAQTISTVPAGNIEPSRGGDGTHGGVPAQQTLQDDPRWQDQDRRIHRAAMELAALVDEARGFSSAGAAAGLSAEEKNAVLLEDGVGLTAEELFFKVGPEYGSPSFIRRWRRTEGLDGRGRPREDPSA